MIATAESQAAPARCRRRGPLRTAESPGESKAQPGGVEQVVLLAAGHRVAEEPVAQSDVPDQPLGESGRDTGIEVH